MFSQHPSEQCPSKHNLNWFGVELVYFGIQKIICHYFPPKVAKWFLAKHLLPCILQKEIFSLTLSALHYCIPGKVQCNKCFATPIVTDNTP